MFQAAMVPGANTFHFWEWVTTFSSKLPFLTKLPAGITSAGSPIVKGRMQLFRISEL
jgi:hypothetical protein